MSVDDFGHRSVFGYVPTIVVIIIGVGLFALIGVPILSDPEQFIENVKDTQREKSEKTRWVYDTNDLVKESRDCKILEEAQLDLISKGANADSWFPNINDKSLKIAQERYDLLC